MENEKKASYIHIAMITGKLMLITCIIAVLIAAINGFTEPVIAANDAAAKNAAVMELFPEATDIDALSDVLGADYPENITEVYAVYKAGLLLGYCVDTQGMGFADNITMMVGVAADNTVAGIRVLTISDTPGIGLAVAEDDYLAGYTGLSYPAAFTKDGGEADAISGATYSSRGILAGVNTALEFCSRIVVTETDSAESDSTESAPADTVETTVTTEEVTANE
ncbi:MAG: FMN-binding protein [Clostridia bacterium]|nr:FMN-binding protein [Clostridia bacterium]